MARETVADLDLDELERLLAARPGAWRVEAPAGAHTNEVELAAELVALANAAPALIAAARELERLRALCREAADTLGAIDAALECECVCDCAEDGIQEHAPECERCAACTVDDVLPPRLRARLREAGGGS